MIMKKAINIFSLKLFVSSRKNSWKKLASLLVFGTSQNKWFTSSVSVSAAFRPAIKARKSTAWASYLQYIGCKASLHTTFLNICIRGIFNYKG
jgi:hypothetical protein